jgi:hypothetical protein
VLFLSMYVQQLLVPGRKDGKREEYIRNLIGGAVCCEWQDNQSPASWLPLVLLARHQQRSPCCSAAFIPACHQVTVRTLLPFELFRPDRYNLYISSRRRELPGSFEFSQTDRHARSRISSNTETLK